MKTNQLDRDFEALIKRLLYRIPMGDVGEGIIRYRPVHPPKLPFDRVRSNYHRQWVVTNSSYHISYGGTAIAEFHQYPKKKVVLLGVSHNELRAYRAVKVLEKVLYYSFYDLPIERVQNLQASSNSPASAPDVIVSIDSRIARLWGDE